jgi:membrane protein
MPEPFRSTYTGPVSVPDSVEAATMARTARPAASRWSIDWSGKAAELLQTLQQWPWLDTVRTLRERFREDRLGVTASSLTFTTLISLVPLLTVMLAVFSAFPMFSSFQSALEKYFLTNLVPDQFAKPIIQALTGFARQAARLGSAGLAVLFVSAIALMLTIDRALNGIWRVRRPRALPQRVLIYWAAMTLGPLLMGVGLTASSFAVTATRDWLGVGRSAVAGALNVVEFLVVWGAVAALFRHVPNTRVRWSHALAGAVLVALGLELAKRLLGWYIGQVPTYSAIYGAFAAVPVLLVWTYCVWLLVLFGAVVAAYAPSLQARLVRRRAHAGLRFELALQVLAQLAQARRGDSHGLSAAELGLQLRLDPLQIEPVLDTLVELDWVGRLDEDQRQRHVLLCDLATTQAGPLVERLLISSTAGTRAFLGQARLDRLPLQLLLPPAEGS